MAPPTALLYWIVITGSIKSAACYGSQGGNRRPAIVSFRGRYLAQQQTEGSQKGGASHLCVLYLWRTSGEMGNFSRQDLRPSGQFLSSTWPWPWPWRSQGCSIQEDFVLLCACFRSQTMWNLTFEIKIEKVKLGRLLTRTCYYELKQTLFNWFRRGRRSSLFCLRLNSCHFAFFARFAADILSYGWAAESHARNLKVKDSIFSFKSIQLFQFKRWIYFQILCKFFGERYS